MAERHSIIVYIRGGEVSRVVFCECCPPIDVEVRSYDSAESSPVETVKPILPERLSDGRWRDHEGTYHSALYELDEDDASATS
ncbi:MAG: hypothetical protein AABZ53_06050 [Planctomycetota bacterium]